MTAMENERYTLSQLNSLVRRTIERGLPGQYWVEAELSEVHQTGGHCYMELIEKDPRSNIPVAKASAKCWHSRWVMVRSNFERVAHRMPAAGMKVLMLVTAQFHEMYGFSWIVTDIDPTFTLGDMARKRQEIIRRLKEEGVIDLNKELPLPMFAQSIAVISSHGAAGYEDFRHQLENNEEGYGFSLTLFEASMQGKDVESSIINALNSINNDRDRYDCVVIIRGGGATSDLSGFDSLALAENVANFPLPVITGIGHERDESVLDIVAHTSVKTPTAAAAMLIDNLGRVTAILDRAQTTITQTVNTRLAMERLRLTRIAANIPVVFSLYGERQMTALTILAGRLKNAARAFTVDAAHHVDLLETRQNNAARGYTANAAHRIELLEQRTAALDPRHILQRGYSITLHDGHAVTEADNIARGTRITTLLYKGEISSEVI